VIIVDPGRGQHARFSKGMVKLGFRHSQVKPQNIDYLAVPFKSVILNYQRQQDSLSDTTA
jgi:ETFB lysine methyltransferase